MDCQYSLGAKPPPFEEASTAVYYESFSCLFPWMGRWIVETESGIYPNS